MNKPPPLPSDPPSQFSNFPVPTLIQTNNVLDNSSFALDIKHKCIIEMALLFTSMIRLFEKGSKPKIANKLISDLPKLIDIESRDDFDTFHEGFCDWFTGNIYTASKVLKNKVSQKSHITFYGHAAKLLDVTLKVYVYYCRLPDDSTSLKILPFLNCAIDNPILNHLKKNFPEDEITINSVEKIDKIIYKTLQSQVRRDIKKRFNDEIIPAQYDDVMWYLFNREVNHTDELIKKYQTTI